MAMYPTLKSISPLPETIQMYRKRILTDYALSKWALAFVLLTQSKLCICLHQGYLKVNRISDLTLLATIKLYTGHVHFV